MRIDFKTLTPILDRIEKNLKNPDLSSIGNAGVADIHRNFDTKGANIGASWDPLKFRNGQPLRDKGLTVGSIHARQVGNAIYIIANRTEYNKRTGRRVNLAHIHNTGWKIKVTPKMRVYLHSIGIHLNKNTTHIVIPKREFMKFSKAAKSEFKVLLWNAILK